MSETWAWALLILGVVRLVVVLNLFTPITRPGLLNVISFFVGWLTGELVRYVLLIDGLVLAVSLYAGAGSHLVGQIGLGLAAAGWLGFALHANMASKVAQAAEEALQQAYGPDYRSLLPQPQQDPSQWLSRASLWRPFSMRHRDVECITDIVYHQEGRLRLRLDLYRPKQDSAAQGAQDEDTRRPILLQIHGGAWIIGSKDHQGLPLMNLMAAQGWLCAAINYRLAPRGTFPDPLTDIKRAIAWLRQHAHEYGGDPDFIILTGGSAGGHLSALCALTANQPAWQPGFEQVDTNVAACVPFYGVYDMTPAGKLMGHYFSRQFMERLVFKTSYDATPERFEEASPIHQIHPDAPAFFIIHGDADSLASFADASRFAEALKATSQQPVAFAALPHTQHAFEIFHSRRCFHGISAASRFLALQYARAQASTQDDTILR